jgi:hypothetical protein
LPPSGQRRPETATILLPGCPATVRIEREHNGDGWLVTVRSHGWLGRDLVTALSDARELAGERSHSGDAA